MSILTIKNRTCIYLLLLLVFSTGCRTVDAQQDRNKPEQGVYSSYTSMVGSVIGTTNNLVMGWQSAILPSIIPMQSPFGKLVLHENGKYEMPTMGYSGNWSFNRDKSKLIFTGSLKGVDNSCWVSGGSYVIKIIFLSEKKEQVAVQYQKKAVKPIPDLVSPNGNVTGQIGFTSMGNLNYMDIKTGKIVTQFAEAKGGWGNFAGVTVHLNIVFENSIYDPYPQILVYEGSGKQLAVLQGTTRNPKPWINTQYWWAEANRNRKLILVNGRNYKEAGLFDETSYDIPIVSVVDFEGNELFYFESSGKFSASWMDEDRILYADKEGYPAVYDTKTRKSKTLYKNIVQDVVCDFTGKKLLIRKDGHLLIHDIANNTTTPVASEGKQIDLSEYSGITMRFSPNGKHIAICAIQNGYSFNSFLLIAIDGSDVRYLLNAQGDIVTPASAGFEWME